MKKIVKWIKEHVKPYVKLCEGIEGIDNHNDIEDRKKHLKENTEVGIKFRFKF